MCREALATCWKDYSSTVEPGNLLLKKTPQKARPSEPGNVLSGWWNWEILRGLNLMASKKKPSKTIQDHPTPTPPISTHHIPSIFIQASRLPACVWDSLSCWLAARHIGIEAIDIVWRCCEFGHHNKNSCITEALGHVLQSSVDERGMNAEDESMGDHGPPTSPGTPSSCICCKPLAKYVAPIAHMRRRDGMVGPR